MQIIDAYNRSEEALTTTFRRRIMALKLRIAGLQIELANRPLRQQQQDITWLMLH